MVMYYVSMGCRLSGFRQFESALPHMPISFNRGRKALMEKKEGGAAMQTHMPQDFIALDINPFSGGYCTGS